MCNYALGGVITELHGERPLWLSMYMRCVMFKVGVEGGFPHSGAPSICCRGHCQHNVFYCCSRNVADYCRVCSLQSRTN